MFVSSTLLFAIVASVSSECGVYIATSTIPGAGLGLFAGKDFNKGERVTWGDLIIPIVELNWNNGHEDFFWLWDEYTWGHSIHSEMKFETEMTSDFAGASFGIGSAINCILGLVNVEDVFGRCDNAGLHRSKDPGSGAFTSYYDRTSVAKRFIHAGDELFLDYGSQYFTSRESKYGMVPLHNSYKIADKIMYGFHRFKTLVLKYYSDKVQQDMWKVITSMDIRATNALPVKMEDLTTNIYQKGSAYLYEQRSRQSLEWLSENGKCVDNIRGGPSTIPQAGRGAFATRFIQSGGLVAPAPLIHISEKQRLTMFAPLPPNENWKIYRNDSAPIHQQLLINYCFGHRDSDMLLSPYGLLVNLINHSQKHANTRIRWSNTMRNPEWMNMEPRELEKYYHSGLMFEFIAIRDIEEGEEILIDYGDEWQAAWDRHVANWKPPPGSDKYMPAYERNELIDSIIPTASEGGLGIDITLWMYADYIGYSGHRSSKGQNAVQIEILDRYLVKGETRYLVCMLMVNDGYDKTIVERGDVLWSLPRGAFYFQDIHYTRDHVQPWSFRHYLGLPDDMFPEAWKRYSHKSNLTSNLNDMNPFDQ
jgi:SET domain